MDPEPPASGDRGRVRSTVRSRSTYRALLVSTSSGSLRFLKTTADRRSASTAVPPDVLTRIALLAFDGNPKLQSRVKAFVEKWLGGSRAADGRFGATRVRIYDEGLTRNVLLSAASASPS